MESASALVQLVHDASGDAQSSNPSESDLISNLEHVQKQLIRSKSAIIAPESSAIAVCHVTSQVLSFLINNRSVPAQSTSSKWHKRVFLLESAVAGAFNCLGGSELTLKNDESRDLCSMYELLLQKLWEMSKSSPQAVKVAEMVTKLSVLLAISWLSYDRVGKMVKIEILLSFSSTFCLNHESTRELVKWPLFLLAMVKMVEKQDFEGALQCFRSAEKCGVEDGEFFYWYAVTLIRCGNANDAVAALDKCIRANYEPTACLSLQALVHLQARDFHAAAGQLQRALEIDFAQSRSLFNYALLMERMNNFEVEQQLFEYVLESRGTERCGGADKDSKPSKTLNDLFDEPNLAALLPSQLTSVNASMVHFHMAVAALENGNWLESKKHFEHFLSLCKYPNVVFCAVRDYIYVLLQCKLPSLALKKCEQYLLEFGSSATEDDAVVTILLLHLYKADALLCLERVNECCEYLKQTVQPKIQGFMQSGAPPTSAISKEIELCHIQLLNNLAVVVACCSGTDAAILLLREGLQQYPDCLAIKFNLVLLLWRKGDKTTACSVWSRARSWDLQSKNTTSANPLDIATVYQSTATSSISEHVQDSFDGEGGVSAQQLVYLDALILNYWRKTRHSTLLDSSLQYVKYLESLGTTNIDGRK